MVAAQPSTTGLSITEHDRILDSAASSWALLQVAEQLPATTDGRQALAAARRYLQRQLDALGFDETMLRVHLQRQAGLPHGCRSGTPPDHGLPPSS